MDLRKFPSAGHLPTLLCAFLYFTISCMAWMMVGALANSIIPDLGQLSGSQKGLMVAVPVLGGALLRLVLGPLTDQIGAKKAALLGLTLTLVPLLMGWLWSETYLEVLLVGLLLGVAGASFAVALPLASRWYPPQYQGLVLGIAGAGNVGTALSSFFGPWVASSWGWHAAFGVALVPVLATLALVAFLAQDRPTKAAPKTLGDYAAVLKIADTGWFCFFYAITFGGFVGLVSFLAIFFRDQYALTKVQAGAFATLCALTGSMIRPLGGYLSDRFGGIRVLTWLYLGVAATMAGVSALPALGPCILLLVTGMTLLGMGNGAVFQVVAQRFPEEIGVITGLVGAAGGLGGFVLPSALGSLRQLTQSYGGGFLAFALVGASGAGALFFIGRTWEGTFLGKGGVVVVRPTSGCVGRPRPSEGLCGADLGRDFSKGDRHCTIATEAAVRAELEVMDRVGMSVVTILDADGPDGNLPAWMKLRKKFPDRLVVFMRPRFAKVKEKTFFTDLLHDLVKATKMGVRGVKIWKDLGMYLRDAHDILLKADDPRLDPFWAKCGELGLPVLIHTADEREYWYPLTPNSIHYGLRAEKDQHYHNPDMPRWEELMRQRDSVLKKHPKTTFIGAHLGSLSLDLKRLGEPLDRYPNFYIDTAARQRILGRLNPPAIRDFFVKYQDRILFGTDDLVLFKGRQPSESRNIAAYVTDDPGWLTVDTADAPAVKRWQDRAAFDYAQYLQYFETDRQDLTDPNRSGGSWLRMPGVKLPPEVLEKLYHANAEKLIPGLKVQGKNKKWGRQQERQRRPGD